MGGLWEEFAPDFGYEIVYRAEFPVGTTNYASQVAEAMAADADIVIAQVIPPDGIGLLREMKASGYQPELVFIEKAGNTGGWTTITEGLGEGTLAANWFAEGMGTPREAEFIDTYGAELGGVDSNLGVIVYAYTAARVLLDAIEAADSTSAIAINAAIGATNGEYPAGPVSFDEGHASPQPVVQTQWQGNDMVLVMFPDGTSGPADLITPNAGLG